MNETGSEVALQLVNPVHSVHGSGSVFGILSLRSRAVQGLFRFCDDLGGFPDIPGGCFLSEGGTFPRGKGNKMSDFTSFFGGSLNSCIFVATVMASALFLNMMRKRRRTDDGIACIVIPVDVGRKCQ